MTTQEWASYKAAIKTLDQGPAKIKAAKSEYSKADAYMQDASTRRTWSEKGREDFYAAAREKRDNVIRNETRKMATALATVRAYNNYPGEKIDLNSTKLQNALSIVNMMGKSLPPAQQLSILEDFRGQPATLEFLSQAYDKNDLYFAKYAKEMAAPIPSNVLDQWEQAIAYADYTGEWDENRIYWERREFEKAANRLGFEPNGDDPFVEALRSMRADADVDTQRVISGAISQIVNDMSHRMTDEEKTRLLDSVMDEMDKVAKAAEQKEITSQARIYEALKDVANNSTAAENGGNDDV